MSYANFRIGAGALTVGGVDVGDTTQEGIVISYEPDVHFHMSGRYGSTPVKASILGVKLTLKITIGESTLANLAKVLPGSVLDGSTRLNLGGIAGEEIDGVPLVMTPNDATEPWVFRDAVISGPIEVAYQAQNERVYAATFTALVDEAAPDESVLGYVS